MTSVSRSDLNDEAPGATGGGTAEGRGRSGAGRSSAGRLRVASEPSKRNAASQDASARAADDRSQAARSALGRRGRASAEAAPDAGVRAGAAVRLAERRAVAAERLAAAEEAERVEREAEAARSAAAAEAAEASRRAESAAPVVAPAVVVAPAPVVAPPVPEAVAPVPEAVAPAPEPESAPVVELAAEPIRLEPAIVEPTVEAAAVVAERATEPEQEDVTVSEAPSVAPVAVTETPDASPAPEPRERRRRLVRAARPAPGPDAPEVLEISGLLKRFGGTLAVDGLDLLVRTGSFTGIVGPNGAGKTTALSMVAGLLRPDAGTVEIDGIDVWKHPNEAKRIIGVVPDRLRTFDRLTGEQLLYSTGVLRGLDRKTARSRTADLAVAFGIEDVLDRLVADYSAGMTKKVALASAMIHAPRLLVLDEPFEGVDPVSSATMTEVLVRYAKAGGTVLLSSHSMDLIERVCDSAVVIIAGRVLASGTLDEVRDGASLEDRFVELAGGRQAAEGMEWLHSFSD